MKRTRHPLWLQRADNSALIGNAFQLSIAALDEPGVIAEIREFIDSNLEADKLSERLTALLKHCHVIIGDKDWEPDSPLDTEDATVALYQIKISLSTALANKQHVLDKALNQLVPCVADDGVLKCNLLCRDLSKERFDVDPILKALRRNVSKLKSRILIDLWINVHQVSESDSFIRWAQKNEIGLQVNIGLAGIDTQTENAVRNISKEYLPLRARVDISASNVGQMISIATQWADLTNGMGGLEFRPISPLNSKRQSSPLNTLPAPEDFTEYLVSIYRSRLISDEIFEPVATLRQRLARGDYTPQCGCSGRNTTAVIDKEGTVHSCEGTMRVWSINKKTREKQENNMPPSACQECQWKFFCGLPCMAMHNYFSEANRIAEYSHQIFCMPRKQLLEEILWDIVEENKKLNIDSA